MKQNKLAVRIRATPKTILDFCLNPKNTPKWIDSIVYEEVNEWPVRVGTIFRNRNPRGEWAEYKVISLTAVSFEFASMNFPYHVRYVCKTVRNGFTELEYFEWMEQGEISEPFTIGMLRRLKAAVEAGAQ